MTNLTIALIGSKISLCYPNCPPTSSNCKNIVTFWLGYASLFLSWKNVQANEHKRWDDKSPEHSWIAATYCHDIASNGPLLMLRPCIGYNTNIYWWNLFWQWTQLMKREWLLTVHHLPRWIKNTRSKHNTKTLNPFHKMKIIAWPSSPRVSKSTNWAIFEIYNTYVVIII